MIWQNSTRVQKMMSTTIKYCCKETIIFAIIVFGIFASSCHSDKKQQNSAEGKSVQWVETFVSGDGWGYEIKIKGKTKIKQPYIPVIEGNLPFDSEIEARRVGELVLGKMKKKGLPSITKHELDSLQIRY
ncbi:MAG TPA: hypothetical protein DD458_21630 [Prolixibacteraceae bacterium]|nr:hypothetical protein [Prolixibacteraceae bacterium]HCR90922.1 hypothetical protein [Prolixibacteraceae bacterium]HCU63319.1 hypothetical protein [Prolixibacteraceae bacterium]